MSVRKTTVRPPRVFSARPGPVAGSATLVTASAARRASYEWEYSLDGGKTWVNAPPSLQTKTTLRTTFVFRARSDGRSSPGIG